MNYMTSNFLQNAESKLISVMALVVYADEEDRQYYIESHRIVDGKMRAGEPLTEKTISAIASNF